MRGHGPGYRRLRRAGGPRHRAPCAGPGVSVYLRLPYAEIEHRLRNIATRGIAMGPGESLRTLYDERIPHYERNADIVLDCAGQNLEETVSAVVAASARTRRADKKRGARAGQNASRGLPFCEKGGIRSRPSCPRSSSAGSS